MPKLANAPQLGSFNANGLLPSNAKGKYPNVPQSLGRNQGPTLATLPSNIENSLINRNDPISLSMVYQNGMLQA